MTELFLIIVSTVLVNNFVLVKFLGLCPFMGVSQKLESSIGMALATTFVLTLSSVCSYLVNTYFLEPFGIEFLRTLTFILVIAVVVQFTEMMVKKTSPLLYKILGIYLPLITTNCAVLGVALLNVQEAHTFVQSVFYGLGAALDDAFPLNPAEQWDTDGDGIGDEADLDDDGDGVNDIDELDAGRNPLVNEAAVIVIINSILLGP